MLLIDIKLQNLRHDGDLVVWYAAFIQNLCRGIRQYYEPTNFFYKSFNKLIAQSNHPAKELWKFPVGIAC